MSKPTQQKLLAALTIACLGLASPLMLIGTSLAQTPTDAEQVTSLLEKFKRDDEWERESTIEELTKIGKPIPSLVDAALKNEDLRVRQGAVEVLKKLGISPVPYLIQALKEDQDAKVRRRATKLLSEIDWTLNQPLPPEVPSTVTALGIALRKDEDIEVRRSAADTLGNIGTPAKTAVYDLIAAINKDKEEDGGVRWRAAFALAKMGVSAKAAVPALGEALITDPNMYVRSNAANALAYMAAEAQPAMPALRTALKQDDSPRVRKNAAEALWRMGAKAEPAMPELIDALKDEHSEVRWRAVEALSSIAFEHKRLAESESGQFDLNQAISQWDKAVDNLKATNFSQQEIGGLRLAVADLKAIARRRAIVNQIFQNPWVSGPGIYLILLLAIFAIRPLWLLSLDEVLKQVSFKVPVLNIEISLSYLLLLLKEHPRVLDAWVAAHLESVKEEFQQKDTVRNRKVYIPIPVVIDGNTVAEISGKDLYSTFKKQRGCLLIWGEGGSGKTSLACQIAQWAMSDNKAERLCLHRMLPVLIEEDLDLTADKQAFIAAIRGQLQDLTNETKPISQELVENLLRQRRILVIVDHLSEMSQATHKAIRPESPDFPVNALIVTSRSEETLGHVTKNTLKPLRVEGDRLSSFMEAYLTGRGKRDLLIDPEFFDACSRLSRMVGERNITVLLAKLYAEQLIAMKEGQLDNQMPDNIPDLMLAYLNELNRSVSENQLSDSPTSDRLALRIIHQNAKILAWECIKLTFRPTSAKREDAIAAIGSDNAEERLQYLEKRLRLIQTIGPGQDQIRFSLDPLAEYLAGLHLLEVYGSNTELWQDFLEAACNIPGNSDGIKGFILAVRDCCLAKGKQAKVPEFVVEELGKLAGITPAVQLLMEPVEVG